MKVSYTERKLVDPDIQAGWFQQVREMHDLETVQDYVELIGDLIAVQGEARLVDLARRLGVSQPTAKKVVARLQKEGFVESKPYRALFLTEKGQRLSDASKTRHQIVLNLLLKLGVSRAAAEMDAEGIEHHVSQETMAAFHQFIKEG